MLSVCLSVCVSVYVCLDDDDDDDDDDDNEIAYILLCAEKLES